MADGVQSLVGELLIAARFKLTWLFAGLVRLRVLAHLFLKYHEIFVLVLLNGWCFL